MSALRNNALMISIFIICSYECIDGLRILGIFPINGKSHFIVCERLAKELAARGHQIDVYSHFPLKSPTPNYTDFSLVGTLSVAENNMSYDFLKQFDQPNVKNSMDRLGNKFCDLMDTKPFQDLFERLKKNQPYDLIIIEVFLSNCYIAWGRYLNIPLVGVMTSSLIDFYNAPLGNPYNTAIHPLLWFHYSYPMSFIERLKNTVMYHYLSLLVRYYTSVQNEYVKKHFGPGYPHVYDLPGDIDLLLVNTHHAIDGIRAFTPAIVPIAGLHIHDDGSKLQVEVQKWLDESHSGCVYMSFGSMFMIETFPKPIIKAFYKTFENIAPVRVLLKATKPEDLPPGLPSNVMTQPWFSQLQILKHKNIKAFITHGGLASTQESLSAGVPLIGFPLFGDQYINIKSQVKKKLAIMIDLKTVDETIFTLAIKKVLTNPIYKKNAKKLAKEFFDQPMSPVDTAVFWVEYIARHGKGALRSPLIDMPWWQANLIDVYGFVLLILVVAYYTIKFIVKKLRRCYYSFVSEKRKTA